VDKPVKNVTTPKTPAEVDKKWSAVTKGLTSREAVYTAHVMEQEAAHLRGLPKNERPVATLKYVFPILRKAVPNLLDGDLTDDLVRDVFRTAGDDIFEIDCTRHNVQINEKPSVKEIAAFVDPLAARAKTSVEGLRDIL